MKIKTQLTLGSLFLALLPALSIAAILGWIAIGRSTEMLEKVAMEHLISVRESNKTRVEDYFEQVNNQVLTLANDRMVINAMAGFKQAINDLETQADNIDLLEYKNKLHPYYTDQFASEYANRNSNNSAPSAELLSKLDSTAVYLQYLYIQNNNNPLGSKNGMHSADDGSEYSWLHGIYHPHLDDYLKKFGYYDIFLVDSDSGRVVYSVYKELDYATSLKNGSFANSGLAKAFQRANNTDKRNAYLEDFMPYLPSYNDPASFIATPIFEQGKKIGVLVFQMPIDKINQIMTNNEQWKSVGMGNSGESYLVGSDFKARSLSRFLLEDKTNYLDALRKAGVAPAVLNDINDKNTNIGIQLVNSVGAKAAISGATGEQVFPDYRNVSVLSAYAPLNISGVNWAILSEIDETEAFAPAQALKASIIKAVIIAMFIVGVIAAMVGVLFAKAIATPILNVARSMEQGEGDLSYRLDEQGDNEVTEIARFFNRFVEKVQKIVREISEHSLQLAETSNLVSSTALQANASINEQQQQIQQVATAMNQMAATVHEVARNASMAAEGVRKSDSDIKEGGQVIGGTIEAIKQLNNKITVAEQTVSQLEEDGQSIGTVLDVIRGIAEQTNLLALNAAIEAARAGEQGRGFAVVADEVRTLASRTQDSTEEIQNMIEKLQKGTVVSAEEMGSSVKLAESAVNQATEGTDALDNITRSILTIEDMTQQIASASEQQSAVAEEINQNISSISNSAENSVAASNESAKMGEDMVNLANGLTNIVKQFKF